MPSSPKCICRKLVKCLFENEKTPPRFHAGEMILAEGCYVVLLFAAADDHELAVDGIFLGQQYVAVLFDVAVQGHSACLQEIVALTVGGCRTAQLQGVQQTGALGNFEMRNVL